MLKKNELEEILAAALHDGGEFADIFLERRATTSISMEDGRIERVNSGIDAGGGVRVVSNGKTAYAYTNDLTKSGLLAVAAVASRAAEGESRSPAIALTKRMPEFDFTIKLPPNAVDVADKVAQVQKAEKAARQVSDQICQVAVGYGDVIQDVQIANSQGVFVEDQRIRTRFVVNAVASGHGMMQTAFESLGGTQGFEILAKNSAETLGESAAQRAVVLLDAPPAPSGKMPVVMASVAGGTMVHEACGHGLEADLVQKKLSVYAGKIGQSVAGSLITVIDDATLPGRNGTLRFDDEGTPARKKVLIENGILKEYMYDWLTASKENRLSTGNGRRESFREKPIPRMTNTTIAPGKDDPEKIIKDTKEGLLVRKMGGGQVNTTNGDFVFDVAEGYLIKDGEILCPVRGATITGNGPKALNLVDRVGSDLGFAIGTCGKDGQGAPVADAQPTMRMTELIVGGTGGSANGGPGVKKIRRM